MAVYTDPAAICRDIAPRGDDWKAHIDTLIAGTDAGSVWMPARLAFDRATGSTTEERWLEAAESLTDPHWLPAALEEWNRPG